MNVITQTIDETIYKDNLSARQIIASKLKKQLKYPSVARAIELENLGIVSDLDEGDFDGQYERGELLDVNK